MPVPWLQIIRWVPPIIELSRELLQRARGTQRSVPPPAAEANLPVLASPEARLQAQSDAILNLRQRVASLEDNERRQAELVSDMASQLGTLSEAVVALHRQARLLALAVGVVALLAVSVLAWRL